ncbi:hypothetical protein GCM10010218_45380 [Streptomyces mashuensis]|uniref:DUF3592 domain-containing protein n=1 Tax=Streptomyces mashuensis TaxID=33904 RepID=A0A919EER8_9ACTN|nr:hypothetical protein [Streptomyces mashuensis]GHF58927.1 hypothetical protein GCM10010218_45380 [Streptomyces mashuensis]
MRWATRITGWATLLVGYATVLLGIFPLRELPPKTELTRLLAATAGCAALWVLASLPARARRRAVPRRRARRRRSVPRQGPRTSRVLCWVLGFGIALSSAAALCQGVGPDGEEGEWLARAHRAGGAVYELRIARIVGEPHPTGTEINDAAEYASTLEVTVPFTTGVRRVTVDEVHTAGPPEAGRTVELMYVPDQPELGVRQAQGNDIGSFAGRIIALPTIWILTLAAGTATAVALRLREPGVRAARRFEPWVHLPAAALLLAGAGLVVPLLRGFPGTGTGWCLAAGAATTPWLAMAWVARTCRLRSGGGAGRAG